MGALSTMILQYNLQKNRKGIGTVFGMVFFLLIVMVVFASFVIVLTQNTGLEQTTIQAKQIDLDRYAELQTVSVTNPEIAVLNNVVYISCSITNNGTLPTELVRLWIKDVATNTVGNTIISPSIIIPPGTDAQYLNFSYVANSGLTDQYSFWFVTTRGNSISGFPDTNQFRGITQEGNFPGVTDVNSTYATDSTPMKLNLTTTKPNQLIYVVVSFDDENSMLPLTSNPTLTWRNRITSADTDTGYNMDGDSTLATFYAIKPSVGPITISVASTADHLNDYYCSALAFAVSDVNTTSPFDEGGPQTNIGKSTMAQDTITTHYSNELIIGSIGIDSLSPEITPAAGFAQIMDVQSSFGAVPGEISALPRSVWSEWSMMQTPRVNLPVNCTFSHAENWAIIVDAVKLVVIPSSSPLSLSPNSGPIGQPITVTGQGFANNSRLTAQFDGLPVPFGFTTDASGNIPPNAILIVPSGVTAGPKNVTIFDSKFNIASATFTVTTSNIAINPQIGPVGTQISVTGSNFITNSNITINFNGNPVATNPYPLTADGTGSFSATFNAASGPAGIRQVSASDSINSVNANFTIVPSITLSPTNGVVGSLVNVIGYGFAASQHLSVTFAGANVPTIPTNVDTDFFGSFNVSLTIPVGQTAGGKIVNASDANLNSATATFTITPSISLSPTNGDVGSTVMVSGSGFAANSALSAKFAGSIVTSGGTTTTDSTGSFTGATFTVPNWASTWAQGSVQTVNFTDAATHTSGTIFTVNTVSQSITVTLSNSAPSASLTVNGGNPNPNTFAADGNSHSVTMFSGSSFNLSFTNSGNTRNGFIVANAFSPTSLQLTSSTNSISVTAYAQVQNTFRATFNSGNPLSGDSLALTGTYLGTGSSTIAALNSGNSWQLSAWNDYNTAVAFPVSTANSGPSEHWNLSSPYSTAALTTGGNTYSQTYYHQYLQTLSYTANGSPTAPTASGLAFGAAYAPTLTTTASPYWFDASGTITFTPSTGVAGERWGPSPASIAATSSHTQVVNMYHQYQVSASYSTSDATSPSSAVILTGTALGSASTPTLTTFVQQTWLDAGSGWSINNPIISGTQRWNTASGNSGTVSLALTIAPFYYHQYQQTLSYNIVGGGSPSAPTATGTASGVAYTPSLTTTASPYWFDASGSVTFSTSTGVAGEQWVPVPSSVTATSAHTQVVSMHHQYQVTFTQNGLDGTADSNIVLTIASTNYAYNTLPSSTYFDATTPFTWASTVSGGSGKQFAITGTSGSSPISAPGTYSATYKTQYLFTVTSAAGTSGGQSTGYYDSGTSISSSVLATVNLVGPPAVSYTSTGFTGTGDAPLSGSGTVSFTLANPSSVTWHWDGQMTLYPDASVSEGIPRENPNNSNHWSDVSDNSDSTYVYASSTGTYTDSYYPQSVSGLSGTISSVTQYVRIYVTTISTNYATSSLTLGSNTITSGHFTPTSTNTWTTHPDTFARPGGGSWTMDDINNLSSGLTLRRSSGTIYCSEVWLVVNFST